MFVLLMNNTPGPASAAPEIENLHNTPNQRLEVATPLRPLILTIPPLTPKKADNNKTSLTRSASRVSCRKTLRGILEYSLLSPSNEKINC